MAGGASETGVQRWAMCSTWDVTCVDQWGDAPSSYGWAGIRVSGTGHVSSGRVVRGYVHVWGYAGATRWVDVRDVRATVVYGILK
jgi:hypothetical protein